MIKNLESKMVEEIVRFREEKIYQYNIKEAMELIEEVGVDMSCAILNEDNELVRMESQEEVISKINAREYNIEMVDWMLDRLYLTNRLTVEVTW